MQTPSSAPGGTLQWGYPQGMYVAQAEDGEVELLTPGAGQLRLRPQDTIF